MRSEHALLSLEIDLSILSQTLKKKLKFLCATIKFIFSSLRESILDILVLKERSRLIYSCNETVALCFFRIKLLWKFNF